MQNRFTFKDFVTLLLLIAVLGSVWLSMVQAGRVEEQLKTIADKIGDLRVAAAPGSGAPPAPTSVSARAQSGPANSAVAAKASAVTPSPPAPAARDERWARAGVAIAWQPPPGFPTDPATVPGYRTGGEFIEVFEAQPAKVTPFLFADVYAQRIVDRVCQSLADFDPKTMKLVGVLADAWQVDPSGIWVRAHLNPAARFSDGTPVTAEDVRWTYMDFIMNKSIDADRTRSTMADVLAGVEVIDPQTVEFTFKDPVFTILTLAFGEPILPKHYYSQFEPSQVNQSTGLLMGSGPFKMEKLPKGPQDLASQWAPPDDLVIVRNETWWAGRAPLEQTRFRTIKDDKARLVSFTNNEASMVMPTSPQFAEKLRTDPSFEQKNYALKWVNMRSGYSFIAWQCGPRGETGRYTPFRDKRVRRAMTLLLDREKFIRDILDGIGIVAKGPFNPESPSSDPALRPLPFDPVAAKKLLKEAGWEDRDGDGILENEKGEKFEFEFTYATGGEIYERMARFIKESYAKAGMVCTTRPVDWARYQDIEKSRDFDAIILSMSPSTPESDPKQLYHSESMQKGRDNWFQWSSPQADSLIEQGRRELDEKSRMLIWQKLEAVIADEQPMTYIRVAPWLRFVKRDFGNVQMYRTGLLPEEFFHAEAVTAPGA